MASEPEVLPMPVAVWEGEFTLLGVRLRCSVLDDGRRVIHSEDVAALVEQMGNPNAVVDAVEVERFARWRIGQ